MISPDQQPRLIRTVEEIKRGNEQREAEVPDETKQDLSEHALTLMAIESATQSAS